MKGGLSFEWLCGSYTTLHPLEDVSGLYRNIRHQYVDSQSIQPVADGTISFTPVCRYGRPKVEYRYKPYAVLSLLWVANSL